MNSNWSCCPETPNLGQIRRFLEPCDLEIWRMTLKNNRAPLLCYFKLYASFRSPQWIQNGVTVRKRPIWVKIDDFFSRVTLQFDVWPWKTNRAPLLCYFKLWASFCSHQNDTLGGGNNIFLLCIKQCCWIMLGSHQRWPCIWWGHQSGDLKPSCPTYMSIKLPWPGHGPKLLDMLFR